MAGGKEVMQESLFSDYKDTEGGLMPMKLVVKRDGKLHVDGETKDVKFEEKLDDIARGKFTLLNRTFDFGAPDAVRWRGEFHEGNNPLRRMTLAYMGYAVPLLARGRAEDATTVAALVASLDAQDPWSTPGVLRDVWNAYTASHRLINLIAGLALYRATSATPPAEAERALLNHARLCAAFVRANLERDLQYNHLMKNYVALALYASACPAVPPALSLIEHGVPATIAQNILPDGGHAERSPMYHALALVDVRVLDHFIVGEGVCYSFAEHGLL